MLAPLKGIFALSNKFLGESRISHMGGGMDLLGGRGLLTWICFIKFVKNWVPYGVWPLDPPVEFFIWHRFNMMPVPEGEVKLCKNMGNT